MYAAQHCDAWPPSRERTRGYRPRHGRPGAAARSALALCHGAAMILAGLLWPEHRLYARLTGIPS